MTTPVTPPAGATPNAPAPPADPPATGPAQGTPPPVTPPATPGPAAPPASQGTPPAEPPKPTEPQGKTFTQADVDKLITDRLARDREAQRKQFAAALGIEDPNATPDPAKALEQSQKDVAAARDVAVGAVAEALALRAGIKAERVDTFVTVAKQSGLFKDVDLGAAGAKDALLAAITAKAAEFPEWTTGTLPGSSTANPNDPGTGNAKPIYTRAQITAMPQAERVEKADELAAAYAEGRIKG